MSLYSTSETSLCPPQFNAGTISRASPGSTTAGMVSTNLNSHSRNKPRMERLPPTLADAIEGRDAVTTKVAVAAAARRKADPPQMITFRSTSTIA
jgi:hypothetical protein